MQDKSIEELSIAILETKRDLLLALNKAQDINDIKLIIADLIEFIAYI
jgi:hypothetical protein